MYFYTDHHMERFLAYIVTTGLIPPREMWCNKDAVASLGCDFGGLTQCELILQCTDQSVPPELQTWTESTLDVLLTHGRKIEEWMRPHIDTDAILAKKRVTMERLKAYASEEKFVPELSRLATVFDIPCTEKKCVRPRMELLGYYIPNHRVIGASVSNWCFRPRMIMMKQLYPDADLDPIDEDSVRIFETVRGIKVDPLYKQVLSIRPTDAEFPEDVWLKLNPFCCHDRVPSKWQDSVRHIDSEMLAMYILRNYAKTLAEWNLTLAPSSYIAFTTRCSPFKNLLAAMMNHAPPIARPQCPVVEDLLKYLKQIAAKYDGPFLVPLKKILNCPKDVPKLARDVDGDFIEELTRYVLRTGNIWVFDDDDGSEKLDPLVAQIVLDKYL